MIGFNYLGNLGHLGNQMFQYAALKGIADNNNYEFCIPDRQIFGSQYKLKSSLFECFDISTNFGLISGSVIDEQHFHFNKNLFEQCPDNISLNGYFQSEKYFKNIESQIRKEFQFIPKILDPSKNYFDDNFAGSEVISIHFRRGDYILDDNHPVQNLSFYLESLSYFDDNLPVLIFSDDPEWCKSQEIFSSDRFFVSETKNCYIDLCLMTLCDYHIIANSSYSWWGSWLSKSKKTIAPKNWFAGSCINYITEDIYCSDWIIL
jgi:hypothetical protein